MDIANRVRMLNKAIEDNYDIIWQEEWYGFYDDAMELAVECSKPGYAAAVSDTASALIPRLDEGGDAPDQEEWFDICESVFLLTLELYNAGIIPAALLDEFPFFYQTA